MVAAKLGAGSVDARCLAGEERLFTPATIITIVRTVVSLVLCLVGAATLNLTFLVAGLATYWVGDMLDGFVARTFDHETRTGAVLDILCDRLNCCAFYLGLVALDPSLALPVGIYLASFVVVDSYCSLAFLAWPIKSPNYFYVVDRRIWRWNWSPVAKALNSALFAVLLLVTRSVELGVAISTAILLIKCVSLGWIFRLGLPVPTALPARSE